MAQRAGVSFEVDRLELEDDRLVVSGFWSGVRGLRFVRPTLVSEDRRILATLEHKPWAPSADAPWVAAFPWDGEDVDADRLAIAVSSQVTVPLGATPPPLRVVPDPPPDTPSPQEPAVADLLREREELLHRLQDAERRAATQERHALRDATALQDDAARERAAAERDRDRALQQLDEAIAAREAAVRTRARMQLGHDEAIEARERAEAALARAQAEREEAAAQRDEVLFAYRTLQRQVRSERAGADRAAVPASAASDDERSDLDAAGLDEPIGVRTLPATRAILPELQHPRREQKLVLSQFDLWIIRALGTVAAGCFILLLFSILRVFF